MKKTLFANPLDVFLFSLATGYYTAKLCWHKRLQILPFAIILILLFSLAVSLSWSIVFGCMTTFIGVGIYLLFFFNEFEDIEDI